YWNRWGRHHRPHRTAYTAIRLHFLDGLRIILAYRWPDALGHQQLGRANQRMVWGTDRPGAQDDPASGAALRPGHGQSPGGRAQRLRGYVLLLRPVLREEPDGQRLPAGPQRSPTRRPGGELPDD